MFRPYRELHDRFIESYSGHSSRLTVDPATGHMRFDPTPPDALLNQFYNEVFTRSEDRPTAEREFTPGVLEVIRGLKAYLIDTGGLEDGFSYHDVGCGFGASVWAMLQLGVKATGNEVNRDWVEAANPHCQGKLSSEPLDKILAATPPCKIDAFFCAHVLEHVADPLALLRLMKAHLSEEGVAYLCLPNIQNLRTMRRGVRDSGAYEFPMHLSYFTPKSLVAMIREAGLEPAQIETRSMFDDNASQQDCENLLGFELFVLAVHPGNTRTKRQADIDAKCKAAAQTFKKNRVPRWKRALARMARGALSTRSLHCSGCA